ncbi:DNA repair protein [Mycobacterium intracellulare]|uniref:DUF488 domain-containing protein n=1 Tax=Mycobacterium intracellulare TaxID=1767 RepID=UPI0007E9F808|nr:DUF488 domain-containing protein [Mycobacterium intracellulare]OBH69727.1 DNA repair protein [Mycobacterium intracellulare]
MSDDGEIWTIGHWTCPVPTFLEPLDQARIDLLVDVRAQPGSRRNPQFGSEEMTRWLSDAGIGYVHLRTLGGRRGRQDVDPTINAGWQNASFKNYADYTLTDEYRRGLAELSTLARSQRVAIMCGEPVPWRCHRQLIANSLVAQGWTVWHLISGSAPREHRLGQWGATPVVDERKRVTYPADADGA